MPSSGTCGKCPTASTSLCQSVGTVAIVVFLVAPLAMLGIYNYDISLPAPPLYVVAAPQNFVDLNDAGVFTFHNVCIEGNESTMAETTRKIVVYDIQNRTGLAEGERVINVAGSYNTRMNHWTIRIVRTALPPTHRVIDGGRGVAYFVMPTCPGNFHHFWVDEFVALATVVKRTGRLFPGARNHVVYRRKFHGLRDDEEACFSVKRYEPILKTLYIDPRHEAFWTTKPNTCFARGVFGVSGSGGVERDVIEHVRRTVLRPSGNVTSGATAGRYVTIQQRSMRRIVNAEQLAVVAARNFSQVRVVNFDNISVAEQMRIVGDSCMLIGVQGAGLQWAAFLPPRGLSTVVEIAWPKLHWPFYYHFLPGYGVQRLELAVEPSNVRVNWASYEKAVRAGQHVNVTSREQILAADRPANVADNLWKWADVVVDIGAFEHLLSSAICRCSS